MSNFSRTATEISNKLNHVAVVDVNAEWQRVNSYIADSLKDTSLIYSKLARLQGDFSGPELEELQGISERILSVGDSLSAFSKAFYEGKYEMVDVKSYRDSGALVPVPTPPQNAGVEPPPPPQPFSSDGSRDKEVDYSMEEESADKPESEKKDKSEERKNKSEKKEEDSEKEDYSGED